MSDEKQTPEQIEADIAQQRDDLAATVTELQARLDVKAKAQAKAGEIKDRATTDDGKPRPELIAGAAVLVLSVIGLVVWRARRDR